MKSSIFVVILNWNGWEDTIDCVKSIKKSVAGKFSLKIVVVDNASTDESVDQISSKFGDKIVLIRNNHNLGYAEGNNVGVRYALSNGADFVCILNNDTVVSKFMFKRLINSFEEHPSAAIASPKMYFAKGFEFHKDRYEKSQLGKVIWYAGGDIDWKNVYGVNHGVDDVDTGQFEADHHTDFGSGAGLVIKREVFEKVGLFDKKYFLYWEDTDLCQRAKLEGFEVWYFGKPHLWHKVSQGSAIGSNLNDYFIHRNRLLFASRYAGFRAKAALFRESIRFVLSGRPWQRRGVIDYYLGKFEKGSWKS